MDPNIIFHLINAVVAIGGFLFAVRKNGHKELQDRLVKIESKSELHYLEDNVKHTKLEGDYGMLDLRVRNAERLVEEHEQVRKDRAKDVEHKMMGERR